MLGRTQQSGLFLRARSMFGTTFPDHLDAEASSSRLVIRKRGPAILLVGDRQACGDIEIPQSGA